MYICNIFILDFPTNQYIILNEYFHIFLLRWAVISSPPRLEEEKGNIMNDNRVDLTYVADRLMRITEISDRRKMETAIEEFKEECLRNIGVNVVNEYNEE